VVRPQDPELTELLRRFVPVRITNMKAVDLNRFRFDYDLTFAVLMMTPDGRTLARFGSQDWRSGTARMSVAGLKNAMRAVLRDFPREAARGAPVRAEVPRTIGDIPVFAREAAAKEACYHCHFAHDAQYLQLRAIGSFRNTALFRYPLPENVGITLEVDRNNVVAAVAAGSPAASAGVRAGDTVVHAGDRRVYSAADLQFALESVAEPGRVALTVERDGRPRPPLSLRLPPGWRRTDISWRPSQGAIPPIIGIWEEKLGPEERRKLGIAPERMALRVSFLFPGEKWVRTRGDLRLGDIITGAGGKALPDMTPRQFHTHFRLSFEVGDTAVLDVLREGRPMKVTVPCLEVNE
jgi:hypothetical protein